MILQPLQSAPVLTDPNEFDGTNYEAGMGLAGASEDSILKLIKDLPCEPAAEEKHLRDAATANVVFGGVAPDSAELQEAKARLAQLRTVYTETNKSVQQQIARIKELENK